MRVRAALLVFMALITVPVAAQWDVGVETNATTFGVRVDRAVGRARLSLHASYASVGLTAATPDLTLTDNSSGEVVEGQLLLNFQVVGIGSSGAVRMELGPSLHLWKGVDETRSRIGVVAASAYEWPVARRVGRNPIRGNAREILVRAR